MVLPGIAVHSALEHKTWDHLWLVAEGFANAAIEFATMLTVFGVASMWSSETYRRVDVRKASASLQDP